jgi:hypothetical protein
MYKKLLVILSLVVVDFFLLSAVVFDVWNKIISYCFNLNKLNEYQSIGAAFIFFLLLLSFQSVTNKNKELPEIKDILKIFSKKSIEKTLILLITALYEAFK